MVLQVRRKRTHFQQQSWKIQQQKRHRQAPPAKMDTVPHVAHVHMFPCPVQVVVTSLLFSLQGRLTAEKGNPSSCGTPANTVDGANCHTSAFRRYSGKESSDNQPRARSIQPIWMVSNPPKFNENYMLSAISYVTISNEM